MPSTIDAPEMPRLDVLDEEFGGDAAALARARRRRTGARLLMLTAVALGLGAIGALAFAWSNADGRLRFDLQSVASPPKNAQRAATEEEIDQLRRQIEALQDDVKELTEAQRQAAYTIATVKAAEQQLRGHAPGPYWYSNPEALNPVIAGRPQSAAAAPLPRRAPSSPPPAR